MTARMRGSAGSALSLHPVPLIVAYGATMRGVCCLAGSIGAGPKGLCDSCKRDSACIAAPCKRKHDGATMPGSCVGWHSA